MAIIKCRMCGGNLEVADGATVGTCDSCGSQMTLPRTSDDRKANLFNRANHFRRIGEFDKALAAYESILNEEDSEAEAHWGVVLSRYGIEYVEDSSTHERIPTCHCVQRDPVLNDPDYLAALEHAPDSTVRFLYEAEAKRIAEIQKGILAISLKEEPFDVFLCYKETNEAGTRTKDSTIAQDIYFHLTQEGFRVFFSRITLEDKLGREYEPYIFAALNSAKIMVVVGTKPEHFTAVWVKNEWSRYLTLMKSDTSRLLIPCYRDMDAYELPEELSAFQSQDMGRIGFIQDLVRGVKKVVASGGQAEIDPRLGAKEILSIQVSPILRRAFLFLEDGDWDKADGLLEQVLNLEPENAQAYIGKLMADTHCMEEHGLAELREPLEGNRNFKKALRFSDEATRTRLSEYNRCILDRVNRVLPKDQIYKSAKDVFLEPRNEQAYREAAELFQTIGGYLDSDDLALECLRLAEKIRTETELKTRAMDEMFQNASKRKALLIESLKMQLAEQEALVAQNNQRFGTGAEIRNEAKEKIRQIRERLALLAADVRADSPR